METFHRETDSWNYFFDAVDDRRATVSVFSSIMATVTGVTYHFMRTGLTDNALWPVLKIVFLSYFLFCFPLLWQATRLGAARFPCRLGFSSINGKSFVGLLMAVGAGLAAPYFGVNLAAVVCALGGVLLTGTCLVWLRQGSRAKTLPFLLAAVLFSVITSITVFGGYNDPMFLESLLVGRTHIDQLNTAAFVNITKTYGIPSTGLDGTPYCAYHWMAMWISAQLCSLLNVDAITFVNLGYAAVIIPLLMHSVLNFALDVGFGGDHASCTHRLRATWSLWGLLFVMLLGFAPVHIAALLSLGLPSSQSMGFSLVFLFMLASILFSMADAAKRGSLSSVPEYVFFILVVPLLFAMLTMTKLSTGFMAAVVYGYLFLRLALFRSLGFSASLIVVLLATVLALKHASGLANPEEARASFQPFHYVTHFLTPGLRPWFFIAHFFWSWLFILGACYARGLRTFRDVRNAFRVNNTIDIEIVLILCVVGVLPGLTLSIPGGSAIYFSQIQQWAAAALLLAMAALPQAKLYHPRNCGPSSGRSSVGTRVKTVCGAVVAIAICAAVAYEAAYLCAYSVYRNVSIRLCLCQGTAVESGEEIGCGGKDWLRHVAKELSKSRNSGTGPTLWRILSDNVSPLFSAVQAGLERSAHYTAVKELQKLSEMPREQKRETLLFIPKSNHAYWNMIKPDLVMALDYPGCKAVPFISPAVSGIASLDGLPIPGCNVVGYHFTAYARIRRARNQELESPESLCAAAEARGFSRVIEIQTDSEGQQKVSRFRCNVDGSIHSEGSQRTQF